MAGTVTIPLTTLTVGRHDFPPGGGGVNVADVDTLIVLAVNRPVSNGGVQGFDGQPDTTAAEITAEQSNDGGMSWFLAVSGTVTGGHLLNPPPPKGDGLTVQQSIVEVPVYPGTGRKVRASVTVSGAQVAVSGSLTIS